MVEKRKFKAWKRQRIRDGQFTKWKWLVHCKDGLKLGKFTDISSGTVILAHGGVTIGDYVQIGPNCSIISFSTIDNKKAPIILKENCRIGANSVVMPGVTVGKNSIVGAQSFVNKDIPDDVTAFGCPARVIKKK